MRKLRLLLACLLVASIGLVNAQTRTASGTVVSAEDGQPIVGASVVVKGTTTGTSTNVDGKFSLNVTSGSTLVISSVGMKPIEVKIGNNLMIRLEPDTKTFDEVMVVAFGTAKKSAFTGSAAVVNSENISKHVTSNVASALVGSIPGLQIRSGSGAPGAGSGSINIRGIASLYAGTDPLIIVDGAPYTASLSNIPPNDIESVSVLKDAASAALYGARGAAGVILVTTKKGKTKDAIISVDVKMGANTRAIQDYKTINNPGDYYEAYYMQHFNKEFYGLGNSMAVANKNANDNMLKELGYNVYTLPNSELLIGSDGKLNPNAKLGRTFTGVDGNKYYLTPDNWTDLSYRTALRKEYNVSVNGGTDRSSLYASVGYLNEDGIIEKSSFERISARVKADYQAKSWFKIGANVGYVHSTQKSNPNMDASLGQTNLMYFTSMIAPIYPAYLRTLDGNSNPAIMTNEKGQQLFDYGVANTNGGLTRAFLSPGNPIGANRFNDVVSLGNQLNGSYTADISFTDYLKFNATSTVIWGQTQFSDYGSSLVLPKSSVGGEITKSVGNTIRTNNIQTLKYFKKFGTHDVEAMVGHEYYRTDAKYLDATAKGAFSEDIKEINAFATKSDSHSYASTYNVEGYFTSVQYNYLDKYFGSASFRRDASSNFAKEHRWGNFWSVGGAWILSKEKFLENSSSWLDMLKLKLSVGQQGNDDIGAFAYVDTYSIAKATETTMSATFRQVGNPDITWETTTNINAGIEFSLWKERLSGGIDIYSKNTSDLLFWLSIPESSGSRGYYGNIGDINNKGIEVKLEGKIIKSRMIDWILSLNASHNVAKVIKLPASKTQDNGGFLEGSYWYKEGGPMYNYMTYSYAGVSDKGEALYWYDEDLSPRGGVSTTNITSKPGQKKSGTTTIIGEATRYEHGSNLPKLFGGIGTTLRVSNFDLTLTFDYQLGGKVYDARYRTLMTPVSGSPNGYNYHQDWKKAWSPNNTSSDIPRWQAGDEYATAASNRWLTNASYLNFQSFNIGYNLPKNLIKGVSTIRVYAAGENLYFWSARKGLDPRYSFTRNETVNVYSPVRNISGGVQFTL